MNSTPHVSVIVPVYNGERYLEECLRSLSAQSLDSIEIIIVDDGSSDGTASICEDYVAREPRAVFLQQPNQGVSAARNAALGVARGKYLAFVDADDYVLPDGLSQLLSKAEEERADLVVADYLIVREEIVTKVRSTPCETADKFLGSLLSGMNISALWNKLIRRDAFDRICFPEKICYMEDRVVLCRLLAYGKPKIAFLPAAVYAYRQSDLSVTASGREALLQAFEAHRAILTMTEGQLSSELRSALSSGIYRSMWYVFINIRLALFNRAVKDLGALERALRSTGLPPPSRVSYQLMRRLVLVREPFGVWLAFILRQSAGLTKALRSLKGNRVA